jgi:hypothetical protein
MKSVMSVRLDEESLAKIRELAERDRSEISTVARELIGQGLAFRAVREYREGRLSLATLAKRLGTSLADSIDLLSELGVQSPLEYDDYLQSLRAAREVLKHPS